jgi:hypothetical protein
MMREYNRDQLEALLMVRAHLGGLSRFQKDKLFEKTESYLHFRAEVDRFQRAFSGLCTKKCFTSRSSACCGREGIATFFADVVINALCSTDEQLDLLEQAIRQDPGGFKCVYLGESGCIWRIKPIVCEMFLCDEAKNTVLGPYPALLKQWEELRVREKEYTWPDKPVLFNELEALFIRAGCDSPLMYFHRSPGLLRIKAKANIFS